MSSSIYLLPGEYVATSEDVEITTILGSCVSVALHDPQKKITGLCHYLIGRLKDTPGSILRYGDQAIPILIDEMISLGANPKALVAKVYGGAKVIENSPLGTGIGQENILVAREVLNKKRIPIISEDTGGLLGRKLHLSSKSFEITRTLIMKTTQTSQKRTLAVKGRVALIDSSSYNITYLAGLMNQSGFEVLGTALDSYDAYQLITSTKPDFIIFGLQNDSKSGLQLIRDIKKMTQLPAFFVYSSGGTGLQTTQAMDLGAVDFAHSESSFNPEMLEYAGALLIEKIQARFLFAS
ncbi:MAG: response regulator [Bdellovibrionaceae bacterium]|nr:response regulator [Bdellovibrio sp.]